jgi:hypothetical protein
MQIKHSISSYVVYAAFVCVAAATVPGMAVVAMVAVESE